MTNLNYFSNSWLAQKINHDMINSYLPSMTGKVYDFGCGTRPYETLIRKYADDYIGIDWGNSLHQKKADIFADLNRELPIEDSVADTVVSFQVLEHLNDPSMMLGEANRILKSKGHIYLSVPFMWWVHEAPFDFYRYTPYGLKHLFEKAGFQNIKVVPVAGFFSMWILKFCYFTDRRFCRQGKLKSFWKAFFTLVWYVGQVLAPSLDKLDKDWNLEAPGYWVVAEKK